MSVMQPAAHISRPSKTLGLSVGAVVLLAIVALESYMIASLPRQRPGVGLYLCVLLVLGGLVILALWLRACLELYGLCYRMDRNALAIGSWLVSHVIPLSAITRIVDGVDTPDSPPFRGVAWPGYISGQSDVPGLGHVTVCSTEPLDRLLFVVTPTAVYGISPRHRDEFLQDLHTLQGLGPVRILRPQTVRAGIVSLPLWSDRLLWGAIIAALMACLALFGLVLAQYDALPQRVPLHFDVGGAADRIAHKGWVLLLPAIGAVSWLANSAIAVLVHNRERLAAYMLVATSLGVQALVWMAVLHILL